MTANESTEDTTGNIDLSLSRFEKSRKATPSQPKHAPDLSGGIVLERFRPELSCKICNRLLKDPVISRSCMHRFCSACVVIGVDISLQTCPVCGAHFTQSPAFLKDNNFSDIIRKIVPRRIDFGRRRVYDALQACGVDVHGFLPCDRSELSFDDIDGTSAASKESTRPPSKANGFSHGSSSSVTDLLCHASSSSSLYQVQPKPKDVVLLNTANGFIRLFWEQLKVLPFKLVPSSVLPVTSEIPELNMNTYSLCGPLTPAVTATLDQVVVPKCESPELKKLLAMLPAFLLRLFPADYRRRILKERETMPERFLLTQRQRISKCATHPLILFPDSSVTKMVEMPTSCRRPRYIYTPPCTTVAHLKEFLCKRAEIEAGFSLRIQYKIEFTVPLNERKKVVLHINTEETDECLSKRALLTVSCGGSKKGIAKHDSLLILQYPFQPISESFTVQELVNRPRVCKRPLKLVFRFLAV